MSREGVCIWCLTKLQIMTGEVERKSIGCNQTLTGCCGQTKTILIANIHKNYGPSN